MYFVCCYEVEFIFCEFVFRVLLCVFCVLLWGRFLCLWVCVLWLLFKKNPAKIVLFCKKVSYKFWAYKSLPPDSANMALNHFIKIENEPYFCIEKEALFLKVPCKNKFEFYTFRSALTRNTFYFCIHIRDVLLSVPFLQNKIVSCRRKKPAAKLTTAFVYAWNWSKRNEKPWIMSCLGVCRYLMRCHSGRRFGGAFRIQLLHRQ